MILVWFGVWIAASLAGVLPPSSHVERELTNIGGPPFLYDVYSWNAGKVIEDDEPEEGEVSVLDMTWP